MYVDGSMKPTDQTKQHVIATYVKPARLKGANIVQVRVGAVQKELGWTNRTPSVFSTLSSKEFQREAGVELIEKRGGPSSAFLTVVLPRSPLRENQKPFQMELAWKSYTASSQMSTRSLAAEKHT
jgi:hypothetical protein